MKKTLILASMIAGLALCGCRTTHKVEHGTVKVAKETGHAIGHATEKVGDSVAHGGEKLENKTDQ